MHACIERVAMGTNAESPSGFFQKSQFIGANQTQGSLWEQYWFWAGSYVHTIFQIGRNYTDHCELLENSPKKINALTGLKLCFYKQLDYELKLSTMRKLTREQPESSITHRNQEQIIY